MHRFFFWVIQFQKSYINYPMLTIVFLLVDSRKWSMVGLRWEDTIIWGSSKGQIQFFTAKFQMEKEIEKLRSHHISSRCWAIAYGLFCLCIYLPRATIRWRCRRFNAETEWIGRVSRCGRTQCKGEIGSMSMVWGRKVGVGFYLFVEGFQGVPLRTHGRLFISGHTPSTWPLRSYPRWVLRNTLWPPPPRATGSAVSRTLSNESSPYHSHPPGTSPPVS